MHRALSSGWMRRVLACGFAAASGISAANGQSTAFTYQGDLKQSGQSASGTYDLQFRLYDAADGGSPVGPTVCVDNVLVSNGRFTTTVDFGQQYATLAPRFLEVAVRPDTGSDCAVSTGFTTLTRQPVTSTPLAAHALGAFALKRPDGQTAVTVNAAGLVGINTTNPTRQLTVAGDMSLGTGSGDYRNLRLGGGNSDGFLYGSFLALGDGVHLGYNYFANSSGVHQIAQPSGATSRITAGYGFIAFATGGVNTPPVNRVTIDASGNMSVQGNVTTGQITRYKTIHGASFVPAELNGPNSPLARYDVTGITGFVSAIGDYIAPVELPHLAVVTEVRIYCVDERSGSDISVTLGRTELATGGTASMATVNTTGASLGVQTAAWNNIIWSTVLNDTHAYWLKATMNSTGTGLHRILGVRITYTTTQPHP